MGPVQLASALPRSRPRARPPAANPGPGVDVAVVGAGPAGRALAGACALRGLHTALVDPDPRRPWRLTYGAWSDELPADLPETAVAARARGRAVALTTRELGWEYAVLDVAGLRAHLDAGLAGVTVVAGRVVHRDGDGVVLADGTTVAALVVVDAGGYRQPLRHPGIAGGSAGPVRPRSRRRTAWSWTSRRPRRSSRRGPRCSWTGGHRSAPPHARDVRDRRLAHVPLRGAAGRRPRAAGGDVAGPPPRPADGRPAGPAARPPRPATTSRRRRTPRSSGSTSPSTRPATARRASSGSVRRRR